MTVSLSLIQVMAAGVLVVFNLRDSVLISIIPNWGHKRPDLLPQLHCPPARLFLLRE